MFWTDVAKPPSIKRAKMNGEDAEKIVTVSINSPGDLAIDTIEEKLYWTDTELNRIEWTDLSGNSCRPLVLLLCKLKYFLRAVSFRFIRCNKGRILVVIRRIGDLASKCHSSDSVRAGVRPLWARSIDSIPV